jgi:hypothetical protein
MTGLEGIDAIHGEVARYYGARIARYGATPAGVDWEDALAQERRFEQLLRVCDFTCAFALNDVGCGYGALARFLARHDRGSPVRYMGLDLSPAMVAAARALFPADSRAAFAVTDGEYPEADYSVASGIFNVKLDLPLGAWEEWIAWTLGRIARASRRGFAVNFVAGPGRAPPQVYRTDPAPWVAFCEGTLGSGVEVAQGYGLDEFTLLVRPRSERRGRGDAVLGQ